MILGSSRSFFVQLFPQYWHFSLDGIAAPRRVAFGKPLRPAVTAEPCSNRFLELILFSFWHGVPPNGGPSCVAQD
jgi:hypothetical protein